METLLDQDESRLEHGRLFWWYLGKRQRLLRRSLDERHPKSDRLCERSLPLMDRVLLSPSSHEDTLDNALRAEGIAAWLHFSP